MAAVLETGLGKSKNQRPRAFFTPGRPTMSSSSLLFYGNKICPFAHRGLMCVWQPEVGAFVLVVALRHAARCSAAVERGLEYSYEHVPLGSEKPAWYTEKVNPRGTVPALKIRDGKVRPRRRTAPRAAPAFGRPRVHELPLPHAGQILVESMWVAEYIDDVQPGAKLVPEDPEERYDVKLFIDEFGRNCIVQMYKLLKVRSGAGALWTQTTTHPHPRRTKTLPTTRFSPTTCGRACAS